MALGPNPLGPNQKGPLFGSRYSIHDLSRCTGEGDDNLARFNMPLELGMAMARRFLDPAEHDWLVMVPNGPAYHRVASDLVGFDLEKHDGSIAGIVRPVVSWLSTRKEAALPVTPREVLEALPAFQTAKDLKAAWSLRRVHTRQARPGRRWNGCRAACNEMPGSDRQAALPETTRATWRFVAW